IALEISFRSMDASAMPVYVVTRHDLGSGVPMFAADFVGQACRGHGTELQAVLAKVASLNRGSRAWLVSLFTLAAALEYRRVWSFTHSDAPYSAFQVLQRRCVRRADC